MCLRLRWGIALSCAALIPPQLPLPGVTAQFWTCVFALFNTYNCLKLYYERQDVRLDDDALMDAYEAVFQSHGFSPRQFARLIRISTRDELSEGDVIVHEGEPLEEIVFLLHGQADLEVADQLVSTLPRRSFLTSLACLLPSHVRGKIEAMAWSEQHPEAAAAATAAPSTGGGPKQQTKASPAASSPPAKQGEQQGSASTPAVTGAATAASAAPAPTSAKQQQQQQPQAHPIVNVQSDAAATRPLGVQPSSVVDEDEEEDLDDELEGMVVMGSELGITAPATARASKHETKPVQPAPACDATAVAAQHGPVAPAAVAGTPPIEVAPAPAPSIGSVRGVPTHAQALGLRVRQIVMGSEPPAVPVDPHGSLTWRPPSPASSSEQAAAQEAARTGVVSEAARQEARATPAVDPTNVTEAQRTKALQATGIARSAGKHGERVVSTTTVRVSSPHATVIRLQLDDVLAAAARDRTLEIPLLSMAAAETAARLTMTTARIRHVSQYRRMLREATRQGHVDEADRAALQQFRKAHEISSTDHAEALSALGWSVADWESGYTQGSLPAFAVRALQDAGKFASSMFSWASDEPKDASHPSAGDGPTVAPA